MKKILSGVVVAVALMGSACSYGGIAGGSNGKVYVARNDGFLFGILRSVYECTPNAGGGEMSCVAAGAP